jgi:hypothetical protein
LGNSTSTGDALIDTGRKCPSPDSASSRSASSSSIVLGMPFYSILVQR